MSLDSLTDLVSNAVGVLILLLLMTALQSRSQFSDPPLPIEHQSGLVPQFFYIHENSIQNIDVNSVFTNGLLAAKESGANTEYQINADFTGRPDDLLTLAINPIDTQDWPSQAQLEDPESALGKVAHAIDGTVEFAFIFVHDSNSGVGYRQFHKTKQWFLDRGIAVGWLPVTEANPAYLCSWSDVSACQYSPSYYGS